MLRATPVHAFLAVTLTLLARTAGAAADERDIVAALTAYFKSEDSAARQALVTRVTSDPAYDRARLAEWLDAADLWEPLPAGTTDIQVKLRDDSTRRIVLRIPQAYDPHQPWPVLYVLHGAGGRAEQILGYFERVLGARAEQFILAAPDAYADAIIHQNEWPPLEEHARALPAIRRKVHVDSDRVYVGGYSRGGHATWTLATLHADQYAGALSLAGTFTILLPDLLWESFVPNLAHLPVLAVWGELDNKNAENRVGPEGGIAGVNRKLAELLKQHALQATMIELPEIGHGDVVPPADALAPLLERRRVRCPREVDHTFRALYQGSAYWLEATEWAGEQWTDKKRSITLREGEQPLKDEDFDAAVARTYRGLLGGVSGSVTDQTIKVRRKKLKQVTLWLEDGLIDWSRPVVVDTGDRKPYELNVAPNLGVCLEQAARTWDFDRLRWAGIRVKSGAKPTVIAGAE